ncbi:MAG: hypothetical protein HXN04_00020 [Porphyromonadaceae bacterium]|nr:hypothetical protein [Porphyromonadaceae bacterium]
MDEISKITSVLTGGALPEGYNPKAIEKLSKRFQKLSEARVIRNYPIRRFRYDENFYSVYAFPIKGTEIAQETLQQIKATVATLDYGPMRYDSMMGAGPDYWTLETETGKHTKVYAKEPTAISKISDAFDGIVIYTLPEYGVSYKKAALRQDIPYVVFGKKGEPDEFKLQPITQSDLGLPASEITYEGHTPESPESARYQFIFKVIIAIVLICYLIYRYLL